MTMKAFTDISQSRKLAEFLPLKSADMGWNVFVDGTTRILPINDWDLVKDGSGNVKFYSAWSLVALLGVLPKIINNETLFIATSAALWHISYKNIYTAIDDNLIDACVDMIETLHEQELL